MHYNFSLEVLKECVKRMDLKNKIKFAYVKKCRIIIFKTVIHLPYI